MKTEVITPSLKNSSISISNIMKYHTDFICDWHIHNECEFYICTMGDNIFWVNNQEYSLKEGDIIFLNSRVPHKVKAYSGSVGFFIQAGTDNISPNINKYLSLYLSHQECDVAFFEKGTDINHQLTQGFEKVHRENSEQNKSFDMFIKAYVFELFAILYRYNILKNPEEYFNKKHITRILPVLNYVDIHFKEHISLDEMSSLLNIDKAHFCRMFKKATNTSFLQYLNFVRVQKAEKLLLTTDKNISEIAEETGFSTPAYFTEIFKANMSCPPSHYKKIKLNSI